MVCVRRHGVLIYYLLPEVGNRLHLMNSFLVAGDSLCHNSDIWSFIIILFLTKRTKKEENRVKHMFVSDRCWIYLIFCVRPYNVASVHSVYVAEMTTNLLDLNCLKCLFYGIAHRILSGAFI